MLTIFQFTKDSSKEYKYTVGESLKKETIELITLIYRANSRTDKVELFFLPPYSPQLNPIERVWKLSDGYARTTGTLKRLKIWLRL